MRIRISLRTALIAVVFICAILAYSSYVIRSAQLEKSTADAVEREGGHLYYDYQLDSLGSLTGRTSATPSWARDLVGGDPFASVKEVSFGYGSKPSRASLSLIGNFTQLTHLDVQNTPFTDSDFESIKHLSKLKTLNAGGTKITDAGCTVLPSLNRLEWLSLRDTPISNLTMDYVAKLTSLKVLDLDSTAVFDSGLANLHGLQRIEFIYARRTGVTSQGAAEFRQALPNANVILEELKLD